MAHSHSRSRDNSLTVENMKSQWSKW